MADTKITALAAITTVAPANDLFAIVDVSDNSMAASGTTKNITTNQILGAGGTATLASATITGNLTVRTNALAVDANNNVGIGTTAPTAYTNYRTLAIVGGSAGGVIDINTSGGVTAGGMQIASTATSTTFDVSGPSAGAAASVLFRTGAYGALGERYRIDGTGISTWSVAGSTAMTLNSTGLGVGGSPATKIFANVTPPGGGQDGMRVSDGTRLIQMSISGSTYSYQGIGSNQNVIYAAGNPLSILSDGQNLRLGTSTTSYMLLDTSGNVGIGVTPAGTGGCLQIKSGITFPATQVASSDANTLDDYEEGTFTPTIVGTTTAGTGTYATQQGRYTKIGNQVSVHIFLDWSAHTGTGNLKLAGLPFQSSNNFHACSIGFWNNIAVTAANVPMAYVINQETNVALLQMPSGGGAMVAIPMDTAGSFVLSATYTV